MASRSPSLSNRTDVSIAREIDSKYDDVKKVADAIEDVSLVADNLSLLTSVAGISAEIVAVSAIADDIPIVTANMTDIQNAVSAAVSAADSAASAMATAIEADTSATLAAANADTAVASAASALSSKDAASISETNAEVSATNALASETAASASALVTTQQAVIAAAKASEAGISAANAVVSETNAAASVVTASTKAAEAVISAGDSAASAISAGVSAGVATVKAVEANDSAVLASAKAVEAAASATTATAKALEASDSADAALQSSIDAEASSTIAVDHIADKNNPHEVTKSQVGLGLVDNTADIDKVVASAGKLTSAVTIGNVSFDGSANIDLPGVNTEGNQNTTGSSAKWTNERTITLSGDFAGSVNIDGSADVEMNVTVSNYAGHTHQFSTITNTPTTLNGYGITDAATSSHVHSASEVTTIDEFNNSNGTNVQDVLDDLDSAIDTEKGRIDAILLSAGANADTFTEIVELINSVDTTNDQAFAGYVLSNDARVLSAEQDISSLESSKADKATTLSGYGITDAYTKTEVQETLPAIGLDTTNTAAPTRAGQFRWNQNEGTADLRLQNGVTLQLGQENNRLVRASGNVTNGRLCMFDGTIGNSGRVKVKHFTGLFSEHSLVYGVATQSITSGSDGYITINGKVRDIDTTGATYGEVWADEDVIYAKPNDDGALTNVEPNDDQLKMIVATVIHAHTNGTLEIRVLPFNENIIAKRANKLTTSRNVLLSGDVSGSAYFDGSSDIDIAVSIADNSHNHTVSNITGLSLLNLNRADKYLASQNVANMVYDGSGKLTKVQYNNATDVDYEVLTYDGNGKLGNVAHYTTSILRGNTVLSYSGGKLVSAIYTGV